MTDLENIPVVGKILTVGGALSDMVLNSGEFLFALAWIAIENVEVVLSIVVTVQRLSKTIPWLPAEAAQKAATAMFAAMLIIYIGRLTKQATQEDD